MCGCNDKKDEKLEKKDGSCGCGCGCDEGTKEEKATDKTSCCDDKDSKCCCEDKEEPCC